MKTIKPENQTIIAFTIRAPEHVVEQLDEFARNNHWSRNVAVRVIIEEQLSQEQSNETESEPVA